jgi:SAM-dependent methyltransferase
MTADTAPPLAARLLQLLHRLGIQQAHFGGRLTGDWSGLANAHPEAIASLTLICPTDLLAQAVQPLSSRTLVFTGDQGAPAESVRRAAASAPDATVVTLHNYFGHPRADVVADHTAAIGETMLTWLTRLEQRHPIPSVTLPEGDGEVAGISYRVRGAGPPLLLLPLGLAPSQWETLLPRLHERYCTIILGGAALGSVASLEARGRSAGYLGVVRNLIEEARVKPGDTILDVGCGTGVLDRWLARRTGGANPIVASDIHRALLREAMLLAREEHLEDVIRFQPGNAEALPFRHGTFDVVLSATVMELLDADRMLHEMIRVSKPGGRIAIVVRAVDVWSVANVPLRAELKRKVEALPNGVAGERGCADVSLYRRFQQAGLADVRMFPQWATYTEAGRLHDVQERMMAALSPAEAYEWAEGVKQAEAQGTFFIALPFHCAVGTKRA